jgi:hypothetical protein
MLGSTCRVAINQFFAVFGQLAFVMAIIKCRTASPNFELETCAFVDSLAIFTSALREMLRKLSMTPVLGV